MQKKFGEVFDLKRLIFFVMTLYLMMCSTVFAQGKKILYVPIDNRPCNLFQVVQVAEKLGYEILTPPNEILGAQKFRGDPDKMWQWLNETAPQADFAVLSTDSLLYGSLVASRIHTLDAATILERAQRFKTFHEKFSWLPIYAVGTVMRTPNYNFKGEVPYYETHGAKIFQYTALIDKQEMGKLTSADQRAMKKLASEIPQEYLDDWFKRRAKNSDANELFIKLTREGVFDFFMLGCDDSAMYSQTHRESRRLTELSADMGKTVLQVTSGADELGMLMIARAINRDRDQIPFVSVMYNDGKGAETFPAYCNEPIGISIDGAIIAAGGFKIPAPERADLVLVVNTRANGKTLEASNSKRNKSKSRSDMKTFVEPLKKFVAAGYPVAVADISFANGADNALMNQLKRDNLQYKIRAYGGWNTATNAAGFLIGAGVLTPYMSDKDVAELLTTRYLDEWAYQANVRQEVVSYIYSIGGNPGALGDNLLGVELFLNEKMHAFAEKNLRLPNGWHFAEFKVSLPWERTFECDPRVKLAD